jgi:hypothetical protein
MATNPLTIILQYYCNPVTMALITITMLSLKVVVLYTSPIGQCPGYCDNNGSYQCVGIKASYHMCSHRYELLILQLLVLELVSTTI